MLTRIAAWLRGERRREAATCYRYEESLFLCAVCEIRNGPGVDWDPSLRLPATTPDEEVGAALTRILDASGRILDLEGREELRAHREQQLRAAGVSSERRLQQIARHCGIAREPGRVRLTPFHNGGTRGEGRGFRPLEEACVDVALPTSDVELGRALREALARCTAIEDLGEG